MGRKQQMTMSQHAIRSYLHPLPLLFPPLCTFRLSLQCSYKHCSTEMHLTPQSGRHALHGKYYYHDYYVIVVCVCVCVLCVCVCVCLCVCMRLCVCVCVCMYVRLHAHPKSIIVCGVRGVFVVCENKWLMRYLQLTHSHTTHNTYSTHTNTHATCTHTHTYILYNALF